MHADWVIIGRSVIDAAYDWHFQTFIMAEETITRRKRASTPTAQTLLPSHPYSHLLTRAACLWSPWYGLRRARAVTPRSECLAIQASLSLDKVDHRGVRDVFGKTRTAGRGVMGAMRHGPGTKAASDFVESRTLLVRETDQDFRQGQS